MRTDCVIRWIKAHKVKTALVFTFVAMVFSYFFLIPTNLFTDTPYSTIVLSREGELLGAKIASDGQWRFPPKNSVPEKFKTCLIEFEDRRFRNHQGVDLLAVCRALKDNVSSGKRTSGASTITMQLVRLSRQKERNLWQKAIEAVMATRIEFSYTKDEILAMYAAHAPFGGNVVGIEAAAWRYFGRPADELSWGESATLAILPNSPSHMHMGKNRTLLLNKRNRLLERLYRKEIIDSTTFALSCEEPLPEEPLPLPQHAFHLTQNLFRSPNVQEVRTAIDYSLQHSVEAVTDRWNNEYASYGIKDLAAVVIDVHTGDIVSYVGNANHESPRAGSKVDIASSPRSTGSVLKPILYCALMQEGDILPHTLLPDTPININGFSPQNYDMQFAGAVPASEALSRSLNVPSVHMLRQYGVPKFHHLLCSAGMSTLGRGASDYGLSLILGGAEGTLLEMSRIYALMSAYYQDPQLKGWDTAPKKWPITDRIALYHTFEALSEVNRPDEMDWKRIPSVRKVAWKTGTSFGFRDAWAIGVTPDYAVGVWAGNARGEGCPGLTGAKTAAPVMFDIFNLLGSSTWFEDPEYTDYITVEVCPQSGHLKGIHCPECDTLNVPRNALKSESCPYHKSVIVENGYRTSKPGPNSQTRQMFILPPAMEWFYRQRHPEYEPLPPLSKDEMASDCFSPMGFIYPEEGSKVLIPRRLDGKEGEMVFNLAHSDPDAEVFWHLDNKYLGSTKNIHQLSLRPEDGKHYMTVVDNKGYQLSVRFSCYFTDMR